METSLFKSASIVLFYLLTLYTISPVLVRVNAERSQVNHTHHEQNYHKVSTVIQVNNNQQSVLKATEKDR